MGRETSFLPLQTNVMYGDMMESYHQIIHYSLSLHSLSSSLVDTDRKDIYDPHQFWLLKHNVGIYRIF